MNPSAISVKEAAAILGVSRPIVDKRIKRGVLEECEIPGPNGRKVRGVLLDSLPVEIRSKLIPPPPTDEKPAEGASHTESSENRHCHQGPQDGASPHLSPRPSREQEQAWLITRPRAEQERVTRKHVVVQKALLANDTCERGELTPTLRTLCGEHGVSYSTLREWVNRYEAEGLMGLRDRRGARGTSKLKKQHTDFLVSVIKSRPRILAVHLWDALLHEFPDLDISSRTLSRWFRRWKEKNKSQHVYWMDKDAWKSKYQPAGGSHSAKARWVNHYWELDSTKADVMCADGVRRNLVACVDIYSRRAKVQVSDTSSAESVSRLLLRCFKDWGLPNFIVRDNGMDYVSEHIDQICDRLEITAINAAPFTPEDKPHVERFFGTLTRGLFEVTPGFCGHNVAERKGIESNRAFAQRMGRPRDTSDHLTPEQLQGVIDRWVENRYHQKKHGSLGMPPVVKAAQTPVAARFVEDDRALDFLVLKREKRVMQKSGIHFQGPVYYSEDLSPCVGDYFEVCLDPENAGQLLVFDLEGRYVTTAINKDLLDRTAAEWKADRKAAARKAKEFNQSIKTLRENPFGFITDPAAGTAPMHALVKSRKITNDEIDANLDAVEGHGVKPRQIMTVAEDMSARGYGTTPEDGYDPDLDDFWDRIEVVNE